MITMTPLAIHDAKQPVAARKRKKSEGEYEKPGCDSPWPLQNIAAIGFEKPQKKTPRYATSYIIRTAWDSQWSEWIRQAAMVGSPSQRSRDMCTRDITLGRGFAALRIRLAQQRRTCASHSKSSASFGASWMLCAQRAQALRE